MGETVKIDGIEYESLNKYLDQVNDFKKFIEKAKRFKRVGWISENTLREILMDRIILLP